MQSKKKIVVIPVELAPVREVEILADSTIYGVQAVSGGFVLAVGSPEGSPPVKRKIWMIGTGMEVSVEAQNNDFIGTAISESTIEGKEVKILYAVFVEKQEDALTRWQHRGNPR
jgi:hypothetical protein